MAGGGNTITGDQFRERLAGALVWELNIHPSEDVMPNLYGKSRGGTTVLRFKYRGLTFLVHAMWMGQSGSVDQKMPYFYAQMIKEPVDHIIGVYAGDEKQMVPMVDWLEDKVATVWAPRNRRPEIHAIRSESSFRALLQRWATHPDEPLFE